MAGHQNVNLRIVLVGRTGSGKSATGNTILGEKKFLCKISAQAVTKECQKASREWKGRKLDVVDTPGLFDTKETLDTTCTLISQCVVHSRPGPHAILLVMPLGRYTAEEQNTVALIKAVFGKAAMKNMIVLFTHKEELGDKILDSFIEGADVKLKDIIKECGNRYFAISNIAEKAEKEVQVQMLVELIEKMVKNNGGAYFSDPINEDTEERLRQRREVLEKIYGEQRDNEIRVITQEYASKPKEEMEEKIKSVKMKYEENIRNIRSVCAQAPGSPFRNMADHQNVDLRIVLVGRTGSGKSATTNTILGEKKFDSQISAQAVTKKCQKASREWKGRNLVVVDTPGLFDTKETLETTCAQISQCVIYSCPGPHAILLVMQLGRYTMEEQNTVALIKAVFGKPAMKNMIVLFTRKEELEDQSLDSFIEGADENLKDLIMECGNRCFAISNIAEKAEKEVQVQMLVELIEKMVKNNGGAYFSDPIYEATEERLRQRTEVLEKIYAEQQDKEIQVIKRECATKPKEEMEEKIKSVKMKYENNIRHVREEAERNIFKDILNVILKKLSKVWHIFGK